MNHLLMIVSSNEDESDTPAILAIPLDRERLEVWKDRDRAARGLECTGMFYAGWLDYAAIWCGRDLLEDQPCLMETLETEMYLVTDLDITSLLSHNPSLRISVDVPVMKFYDKGCVGWLSASRYGVEYFTDENVILDNILLEEVVRHGE